MRSILNLLPALLICSMAPHALAERVDIQWLGGPTMLIEFGPIQVLTDPMLGEGEKAYRMADPNEPFDLKTGPRVKDHKRLTPLPELTISNIDVVAISHSHEDHFDQVARTKLPRSVHSIVPTTDEDLMNKLGFTQVQLLEWGKQWKYQEGDYQLTLTATPAFHTENAHMKELLGHGNGYLFEFKHGNWKKTLYWMGDTFLTQELKHWLADYSQPDILVPHLGRVGTTGPLGQISMGASDVVESIHYLKPAYTLPIHHSTYELYLEPISELVKQTEQKKLPIDVIAVGSWITYR